MGRNRKHHFLRVRWWYNLSDGGQYKNVTNDDGVQREMAE